MKKIELKLGSVKETLTREQMKQIGGGIAICLWESDDTNPDCDDVEETGFISCNGSEDWCNGYMQSYCNNDVCCTDVSC